MVSWNKNMLHLRKKVSEDGKRKEGRQVRRKEGKKDDKKVEVKNARI